MEKLPQMDLIAYAERFAAAEKTHVWLGGSFGRGTGGRYSDVDLAMAPSDTEVVRRFIYGYAQPVFLSKTENPRGILIVVYENGIAVDLEVLEQIDFASGGGFFHRMDYKRLPYTRDENIWRELVLRDDPAYARSRLFHRCLLKFLAGREREADSILQEVASFFPEYPDTSPAGGFKERIVHYLTLFGRLYDLPEKYRGELYRLIGDIQRL